ncbi:hypothetical protein K7X08_012204 [Anisodus acutangulus]|uniref:Uncharacterized protein n=1 Tax=Anisodus acutangulus TaxID=402998 RepID=A0A9Q1QWV8_9SOLA|nr:hypothetical protein K7X08_012204 [Anisodus acutangulus]
MGNIVLFDERKRIIWKYFDHPTDSLLLGQNLVSRNYTHLRFDGHTLSLACFADRFLKLEHNGHLRVYKFDRDELDWKVESDVWVSESNIGNCGYPMNLDWTQADEEDVHLLSVFRRKAEQEQLMDMVDKNEDMQLHREAVTEMMSLAAWCLQGDFAKRPSTSLVVKALEGLVTVETNLNYNFTSLPEVGADNQQREATISSKFPSVLSGPR